MQSLLSYREKNQLDLKSYKEKLDSMIKGLSSHTENIEKNANNYTLKMIKDAEIKTQREFDNVTDKIMEVRMENNKYSIDLQKKASDITIDYEKLLNIKTEIITIYDLKVEEMKSMHQKMHEEFEAVRADYETMKAKFNSLSDFLRDAKKPQNLNTSVKDMRKLSQRLLFSSDSKQKDNNNNNFNISNFNNVQSFKKSYVNNDSLSIEENNNNANSSLSTSNKKLNMLNTGIINPDNQNIGAGSASDFTKYLVEKRNKLRLNSSLNNSNFDQGSQRESTKNVRKFMSNNNIALNKNVNNNNNNIHNYNHSGSLSKQENSKFNFDYFYSTENIISNNSNSTNNINNKHFLGNNHNNALNANAENNQANNNNKTNNENNNNNNISSNLVSNVFINRNYNNNNEDMLANENNQAKSVKHIANTGLNSSINFEKNNAAYNPNTTSNVLQNINKNNNENTCFINNKSSKNSNNAFRTQNKPNAVFNEEADASRNICKKFEKFQMSQQCQSIYNNNAYFSEEAQKKYSKQRINKNPAINSQQNLSPNKQDQSAYNVSCADSSGSDSENEENLYLKRKHKHRGYLDRNKMLSARGTKMVKKVYFIRNYSIDLFEKNEAEDYKKKQYLISEIKKASDKNAMINDLAIILNEFNDSQSYFKKEFIKKVSNTEQRIIQLENFWKKKMEELTFKIKNYLPIKFNPYIKNYGLPTHESEDEAQENNENNPSNGNGKLKNSKSSKAQYKGSNSQNLPLMHQNKESIKSLIGNNNNIIINNIIKTGNNKKLFIPNKANNINSDSVKYSNGFDKR